MKLRQVVLTSILAIGAARTLPAQSPVLSSIEAPYPDIPSTVHVAGGVYGPGSVPYGPAGTPLILSGSDFGPSGTVQFIGYKNGAVDPGTTVQTTGTMWTPSMIFVNVPAGAVTGLVKVTSSGHASNGLPILVTPGTYAGSCPAFPPQNQLQITTASLNEGVSGQPYSATLSATGGTQAYSWSITNGSLPTGLSLNASTGVISGTPTGTYGPADLTVQVADSSSPQKIDRAVLSITIDPSGTAETEYSYCISASPGASCTNPSGGYDAAGNVVSYYDSVTGTWSMANGYDSLNRLVSARATAGSSYSGLQASWSYDSFGNRLTETFGGTDTGNAPVPPGTSLAYNANNRITGVGSGAPPAYDAAGNVICDSYNAGAGQCVVTASTNQYLYDGEGRICAVATAGGMFGYLYDAEGTRIAKGTITTFSCDTSINQSTGQPNNGFSMTTSYILGPGNEQLTELKWSGGVATPAHTNVFAAGLLVATYSFNNDPNASSPGTVYFHITDWLGTRRALADYTGELQQTCDSLPFGNGEDCATLPTEHLFTGKERDQESGNDYFGARYYASNMGRMLSPDPSGLFFADRTNPQSLNLYAYVRNNPLAFTDPTGLYCAWEDGTSDDDPKDGGATKKQCKQQGGHWTDAANPCHGMDNCVATFDWNNPQRDKTPTFDPRLDPQLVGVMGALPTQPTVSNIVDPDAQRIQQLADAVKKKTDCAVHSLLKSSSTIALDAVGMVPFGGTAEAVVPVANGAVSSVTSAVQGDTTGSALSTVDMVQGAAVKAVTSPAIGINAPKAIPLAGQAYSGALVARDIWNASGEYANCF